MCMSDRLKQILEVKGMSVKEFSELTGISYRSAMNYLNEGRDPNVDGLVKIHEALGVSITWLLTGKGTMFNSVVDGNELSEKERELISHYRMLSDDAQTAFDVSFKFLTEKSI
ncbi:helix-turn-helix domain-containing protein [Pasteurella multocida]|uniref:helix-turn-helix domain-containing protein n=1 Tax=Pasteurella multocida TaxID=747 RepID=UPI002024100E|nr:helix-turn-helix transcriptional regulator [Pasteurella multocida]MDT8767029.1 helix-turn-helix domain-containing protein [Pasteurella multocida]URJ86652.1 helix-turn-helix domain-containing protein [Pasteurella multocida]URJ88636.1 helix-turn-helix domain-containing protein [Pasteurella multocida]HDR0618872.1 helix-turn-helix transcriptional regulator [Pasteurella multocida]